MTEDAHKDGTLPNNLTVKTVMDTWTLQMGFPVVTVTRHYNSTKKATLNQQRFLLSKTENNPDKHDYKWWIPITFTIPGTDFNDTFVPVSRSSTIRLMMALSVEHDLIVHQIDVVSRCFSTEKNKKPFI